MKAAKRIILLIITLTLVSGLFNNSFGQVGKNESLAKLIINEAFLVDVRTPQEFAEGSVKGSVNIPLDKLESQLEKFNGKQSIIVFCRSDSRSNQAKAILNKKGFINVT